MIICRRQQCLDTSTTLSTTTQIAHLFIYLLFLVLLVFIIKLWVLLQINWLKVTLHASATGVLYIVIMKGCWVSTKSTAKLIRYQLLSIIQNPVQHQIRQIRWSIYHDMPHHMASSSHSFWLLFINYSPFLLQGVKSLTTWQDQPIKKRATIHYHCFQTTDIKINCLSSRHVRETSVASPLSVSVPLIPLPGLSRAINLLLLS